MKKKLSVLMSVMMICSLCACSNNKKEVTSAPAGFYKLEYVEDYRYDEEGKEIKKGDTDFKNIESGKYVEIKENGDFFVGVAAIDEFTILGIEINEDNLGYPVTSYGPKFALEDVEYTRGGKYYKDGAFEYYTYNEKNDAITHTQKITYENNEGKEYLGEMIVQIYKKMPDYKSFEEIAAYHHLELK